MKTYTSIIFDLDDTLWDTRQNSKEALEDIFDSHRLNRFYEKYEDFYILFLTLNESLWEQYNHGKISREELQNTRFRKLLSQYEAEFDFDELNNTFIETTCSKSKLIEGAHEILEYLSVRYQMAILSNSFERALRAKVKSAGFEKYFKAIHSSELIKINKPAAGAFEYAISSIGGSKDNSIMIGDNLSTDIRGAKNSGVDQVWLSTEDQTQEIDFTPTYTINSLLELRDIL